MNLLKTESLIIRDYIESDLNQLHHLLSDNDVMRFIDFGSKNINDSIATLNESIEEAKKDKDRIKYYFAIILKENMEYIGDIGFSIKSRTDDAGVCNLGYFIHKKYWNLGFVTEAVKKISKYIFTTLKLHKIESGCIKENTASERILIKCGFKKEADLKRHSFINGKWNDRIEYGLLKDEWYLLNKKK